MTTSQTTAAGTGPRDAVVGLIADVTGVDWQTLVSPGSALGHALAGRSDVAETDDAATRKFNNFV